jgi:hypothetical protein
MVLMWSQYLAVANAIPAGAAFDSKELALEVMQEVARDPQKLSSLGATTLL